MNRTVTIFVYLLDEGTDCWRPVEAEDLNNGTFRIISENSEDENWQFEPGDIVSCMTKRFQNGQVSLVVETKQIV